MTERNPDTAGIQCGKPTFGEGTRKGGDPFDAAQIVGYFKGFATKQMHEANAKHTQNGDD